MVTAMFLWWVKSGDIAFNLRTEVRITRIKILVVTVYTFVKKNSLAWNKHKSVLGIDFIEHKFEFYVTWLRDYLFITVTS